MIFNDETVKFESQIVTIDLMIHSIDDVLTFIHSNKLKNKHLTQLLSKIFKFCGSILEIIPDYIMVDNTKKRQLLASISIVNDYWNNDDMDMFLLNWSLFITRWANFVDIIKKRTTISNIHIISMN